jgi:hypothetical protein
MPAAMETMMLKMFISFEPRLISSPFSFNMRILLPIKAGTSSFGEMIAVASPYIRGCTVGKVEIAPLQIE